MSRVVLRALSSLASVRALYSVAFYHGDRSCSNSSKAMAMYGGSIPREYADRCRYAETLREDGTVLYHLAWSLACLDDGRVSLVDYVPSIGGRGCAEAPPEDAAADPAYAFTLTFASGECIEADSPDGDPSGESWMVTFDGDACGIHTPPPAPAPKEPSGLGPMAGGVAIGLALAAAFLAVRACLWMKTPRQRDEREISLRDLAAEA